ncbi:MAG: energy-coupling factor ABC transporter permease [Bacillota bacterium]
MHIQDTFLTGRWVAAWYVAASVFVGKGIYDIKRKSEQVPMFKPLVGMMGAAVFFISLIPIPVPFTGTSSHPAGTPLAAILLGPFVGTVLSVAALLLQALFFAHGGLSTLGANVVSMGVAGSLVSVGVFLLARKLRCPLALAAGLAGFFGDLAVYFTSSLELALGLPNMPFGSVGEGFITFLGIYVWTQLPIAVLEGVVTGGMVAYTARVRPDIFRSLGLLPAVRQEVQA